MIVRSAEDLKDPFICYCVMMRFMEEEGEDYADYNETLVNPWALATWMYGKGYITKESLDALSNIEFLSLQDVLFDEYTCPKSYGSSGLANDKMYSIFAEYLSSIEKFRQALYDSVNDKATGFIGDSFYKDENGVSLACIIDDSCFEENEDYINGDVAEMAKKYNVYDASLKDGYNLVIRMSIAEADVLSED